MDNPKNQEQPGSTEPNNISANVSGPISQTSSNIKPGVPNQNAPTIEPLNDLSDASAKKPVDLADLDAPLDNSSANQDAKADTIIQNSINNATVTELPDTADKNEQPGTLTQNDKASEPFGVAESNLEGQNVESSVTEPTPEIPDTSPPTVVKNESPSEIQGPKIETKSGDIPVTEAPNSIDDLEESKQGIVSPAPTDHPKRKKLNYMVIIIAIIMAVALAAGAGYAYWQNYKAISAKKNEQKIVKTETPKVKPLSASDLDKTNAEIDTAIAEIAKTDEILNSDLSDTYLGL